MASPDTTPTLLGRVHELAELRSAYAAATTGRGSVVLLSGEPGIGKTRLAEAFSEHAAANGAQVRWGRVWEVDGAPPGWPWAQLLRPALQEPAARPLLDDPAFVAQLAPLLPDLGPGASSAGDPFRLAAALLTVLERLAASAPQVLVLDDLHAADGTTLTLLEAAARELRRLRVLVIGTLREVEARQQEGVSASLTRIARHGITLPLGRLDSASIARLVEHTIGARTSPALEASVARASEGNPLFAAALARLATSRAPSDSLPLPDTIRDTLRASLELLTAPTREVLGAASVLGREGAVPTLERLAGLSAEAVSAALDEASRAGVLDPPSAQGWRFSHVLLREVLEQGLTPGRRIALHIRCTELLTAQPGSEAELAHHARAAGAWPLALEACSRAGRRAFELPDFAAAADWFERALEAHANAGSVDLALRAELLLESGHAQIAHGRARDGKQRCLDAMTLATELGSPPLLARAALAMGVQFAPGRVDADLVSALEKALAMLPSGEVRLRALVMARLGAAMMPSLHPERPLAIAREAIALARLQNDQRLLAQVLSTARSAFTPADGLEERFAMDEELARLAVALGARDLALQARCRLALDAFEKGDGLGLEGQLVECDRLTEALRLPWYRWRVATIRLCHASTLADPAVYARRETELLELATHLGEVDAGELLLFNRLLRARMLGRFDDEDAQLTEIQHGSKLAWMQPFMRTALRCSWLSRQGRNDEARALLASIPRSAIGLGMGPSTLVVFGECAQGAGDLALLEKTYRMLGEYEGAVALMTSLPAAWGPLSGFRARFASALGLEAEAKAHLANAIAVCERLGADGWLASLRAEPAKTHTAPAASLTLTREGELWTLALGNERVRLKDAKGLHYLSRLVGNPGHEFHVADLVGAGADDEEPALGDAGEMLDARARAAYRERLEALDEEIREATEFKDSGRLAKARAEREALSDELARAVGLGGRSRKAASGVERARINVQRRLKDVIERATQVSPALGRHLEAFVRTGAFCSYQG